MFKPTSVDKIISAFTKAIKDLHDLENSHLGAITDAEDRIGDLRSSIKDKQDELARATAVRIKLQSLTSI